jgi:hypothetical protein
MEDETPQPIHLTVVDDHWLLDHHIEELLGTFCDAGRMREINPDAVEQPFD